MYLMTKRFTESQLWNIFRKSLWCFFSPFSLKAEWWTYKYLLHLHENQPSFFSKMRWIAQICILFILIFRQITTFYLLSFGWNFNDNPLQDSCLGNPMDRGAWKATVHRVAKSRTRLSDPYAIRAQAAPSPGSLARVLPARRDPPCPFCCTHRVCTFKGPWDLSEMPPFETEQDSVGLLGSPLLPTLCL